MNLENMSFLDFLTVFSVGLQVMTYGQGMKQTTTDDIMRELQEQDRKYLEKILENQKKILDAVAPLAD